MQLIEKGAKTQTQGIWLQSLYSPPLCYTVTLYLLFKIHWLNHFIENSNTQLRNNMYLLMAYLNYTLNIEAEAPRSLCCVVVILIYTVNECCQVWWQVLSDEWMMPTISLRGFKLKVFMSLSSILRKFLLFMKAAAWAASTWTVKSPGLGMPFKPLPI